VEIAASSSYRYGFNGQERSTELGNDSYTAEFWQYDSRLGRRWNVDPLMKPHESPYAAFSNNPIINIDPHGDSDSTVTTPGGGSTILPGNATNLKPSHTGNVNGSNTPAQHTSGAVESFQIGDKTFTARYNSKTGEFARYAHTGADGKIEDYNPLDYADQSTFDKWYAFRRDNFSNRVDAYRAWQGDPFEHPGESALDRRFRWSAAASYEARREFAAGGYNMYGGFSRAAGSLASSGGAYAGVRAASAHLISQGVPRATRVTILQSFEVETIALRTADNATFGLRFFDNANAYAQGKWLFPTFTNYTSRSGMALPYNWNHMTNFTQWQIPSGSTYIFGRAASQGNLGGGSYQMVVPNPSVLIK
jgi:RHS repeat-associated protein